MLVVSERWKAAYPGASVGVLVMSNAANHEHSLQLDARKEALLADLRSSFASLTRSQLKRHPMLAPYTAYYKRFDKTYHVQHQLESVIFKGKSFSGAAALVEAMFMAELKNLLLTAGHDLNAVQGKCGLAVATGLETYTTLTGQSQTLKQGDMFIHDEANVLSCIIYGPDHRTRIRPATTRVLFTVYAPAGIPHERIRDHLNDLTGYVLAVAPSAQAELEQLIHA